MTDRSTFVPRWGGLAAVLATSWLLLVPPGCADECVTKTGNPGDSCGQPFGGGPGIPNLPDNPLLEQCGLSCAADGILEGNAAISGIASIDAFFRAIVSFQLRADHLGASIDAELAAIRAAFGVEAGADLAAVVDAEIAAHVDGRLSITAAAPRCETDARAALELSASCDADIDPGSAEVACDGACEVTPGAGLDCGADADLSCTFTSGEVACDGECAGSCRVELTAAAACDGKCIGSCDGACSVYSDAAATECAGACDGMCQGSCEAELAAPAICEGTCRGQCTMQVPDGECEGALGARCTASGAAPVMCAGRCEGEVTPPTARAECESAARAEARMSVECTPPRLSLSYQLAPDLDAPSAASFRAAMAVLEQRLPNLLALARRAELVAAAGVDLAEDAEGAPEGAFEAVGEGDLRAQVGAACAVAQLPAVATAVAESLDRLEGALLDVTALTAALNLQ